MDVKQFIIDQLSQKLANEEKHATRARNDYHEKNKELEAVRKSYRIVCAENNAMRYRYNDAKRKNRELRAALNASAKPSELVDLTELIEALRKAGGEWNEPGSQYEISVDGLKRLLDWINEHIQPHHKLTKVVAQEVFTSATRNFSHTILQQLKPPRGRNTPTPDSND